MAHTPYPPLKVEKGQRIAQLVPLPQLTSGMRPASNQPRTTHGFGSTGLTLLSVNLHERPKERVELCYRRRKIELWGLLDTGADTSIISPKEWPQDWLLFPSADTVTGVGGLTLASKTPPISIQIDGQQLIMTFSVVQLPPTVACLIGRDVLAQLGVVLTNEHPLG